MFSVNAPAQYAIERFMRLEQSKEKLGLYFQNRRDSLVQGLKLCGFKVKPANGTYFQLANYAAIKPDMDELCFARWLTVEHGVACIPLAPFYQNMTDQKLVRFCFAKKQETLDAALLRLKNVCTA